jgi:ubiquitin C-terminal hydrolase
LGKDNLEDSFSDFFIQELLSEGNRYNCQKCGAKVTAKKGYFIEKSKLLLKIQRPGNVIFAVEKVHSD